VSEDFPIETLRALVCPHVDAGPGGLEFEKIPTGHFNASYFVDGGPRPMVLRIAPPDDAGFVFYERGMMAQEPGLHRLIRERTSAPVAEIIAYDTGRAHIDRDYLLMERLPGVALTHFHPTPQQLDRILEQTGAYLRQIHEITTDKYGYLGEHKCMEAQEDWAGAFSVMWNRLIDDIVQAGYYDASEEALARGLLEKHAGHFQRPVTSRLLHMDIWSQNILVDERANVTGVVDFDRALWGDKEIEFAVLDYCGISEPAFWRGYGQARDVSYPAQVRRQFYLIYEVQKYIVIYHYRNSEPKTALRYKQQVMGMLGELT
jgi:aminoglycoside phosphotransferase (APT) family kinase protein